MQLTNREPGRRQTGSVVINAAIALSLIVIVLVGTELGYLFYMKRELQKAADLSALAGAQVLRPTECSKATTAASANAARNLPFLASQYELTAVCGVWNPTKYTAGSHFSSVLSGTDEINALSVTIVGRPPLLFPSLPGNEVRAVTVSAIAAKDEPLAVFSVGSKLVDINPDAPLISILKFVGADISGSCGGCYSGLVGVKITPGGLLAELKIPVSTDLTIGDLNALLVAKKVTLGQLLNAVATIAGQTSLVSANATLVKSLLDAGVNADNLGIQLGTDSASGVRGLFAQITAPTSASALSAEVDALDLITTAVGIGTSGHAVNVSTGVSPIGVTLQSRIIEPPSIGIGPIGTKAYNSQVRIALDINSSGSVLGGLLGALGTEIHLPMAIDVVNAFGRLDAINCDVAPPEATIHVDAPILNACIGNINPTALWSKSDVCTTDLGAMPLVKLLGINLLNGKVAIPALPYGENITLSVGETKTTSRNPLNIGSTIEALLDQLLKLLLGGNTGSDDTPASRASNPEIAAKLADYYITRSGSLTNVSAIKTLLYGDHLAWNRPGLLNLLPIPMPEEWAGKIAALPPGGCTPLFGSPSASCIRTKLIESLQSSAQNGIVGDLLGGLVDLVSNVLGLDRNGPGTPLLSTILGPLLELLQPILDSVGGFISNLLGDTLGLELGRTDVHLQSLNCKNAKLVY
ncbi:TadG family pilus assembly protein [Variovorax sp. V116]|uniref:TadG family pilus assembly protein n=1 Tax=Variovorax sp. V116 TaxID=3065953 RepID=UPI0034E8CE27